MTHPLVVVMQWVGLGCLVGGLMLLFVAIRSVRKGLDLNDELLAELTAGLDDLRALRSKGCPHCGGKRL